jgi:hypothetical protein
MKALLEEKGLKYKHTVLRGVLHLHIFIRFNQRLFTLIPASFRDLELYVLSKQTPEDLTYVF